jgi:hypothetical protein
MATIVITAARSGEQALRIVRSGADEVKRSS